MIILLLRCGTNRSLSSYGMGKINRLTVELNTRKGYFASESTPVLQMVLLTVYMLPSSGNVA